MRIAYLTTDEVNQDLALQLAAECGVTVHPRSPRDAAPDGEFDALLYDWDYWPADRQQEILTGLLNGAATVPVGLHSYRLEEDQVQALRRSEVAVFHRLEPDLLLTLIRLVNQSQTAALMAIDSKEDPAAEDLAAVAANPLPEAAALPT